MGRHVDSTPQGIPYGLSRWSIKQRMERDGMTLEEAIAYEQRRPSVLDRAAYARWLRERQTRPKKGSTTA